MPSVSSPARIGVVGFDFGTKPAFSLAVPPRNYPIQQQDPEPVTPLFCHDRLGDTLPCVTAGIVSCGVYIDINTGQCFIGTILTGVNTAFNVTWNAGLQEWINASIGQISTQEVDCDTLDPIGDPEVSDVAISVSCDPATEALFAQIIYITSVVNPQTHIILSNSGFLDAPIVNTQHCVGNQTAFGEGSLLISTP